jgi:cation diffusion facilitator CzcD-associated flavoprotein CzcO
MTLDIDSVAIIGAGPSGVSTLYELLHTSKDGKSTVGGIPPANQAFGKIVGFEQNSTVGGVWATDLSAEPYGLPPQQVLETNDYHKVKILKKYSKFPDQADLEKSSVENPIVRPVDPNYLQWNKSPVYPSLYTNIPGKFMRLSSWDEETGFPQHKDLDPLVRYQDIHQFFENFSEKHGLKKYFRSNTEVVRVFKDSNDGKWNVVGRSKISQDKEVWYQEKFDAVAVAAGHYTIPYIPLFEGLPEYQKAFGDKVEIIHSKNFRNILDYTDKNVLVVGASISGIDIAQYVAPVAKTFKISLRANFTHTLEWLNEAIDSLDRVDVIKRFNPENGDIELVDGNILKDIDAVIICTGYHVEIPFLDNLEYSIPPGYNQPTPKSRIKHLYQNVFNIEDPTLAVVGALHSPFLIKGIESVAAAVAGIWSGAKSLPPKTEQYRWEEERLAKTEDSNNFQRYSNEKIGPDFIDNIKEFYAEGRQYPLDNDDEDKDTYERGEAAVKDIFFSFRNGDLPPNHRFL